MHHGQYIDVTEGHSLYFEDLGPKEAIPILFIHGGPGAGFTETCKIPFDLTIQRVIFFEQRGAGRSKPFASIENNTTDHLVADINRLLDHLSIQQCILYGGSWGSTLALVYAIRHTHRVLGLVLRGVFLSTQKEYDHLFVQGSQKIFPEAVEKFLSLVPKEKQNSPLAYYASMLSSESPETVELFARAFASFEISISKLDINLEHLETFLDQYNYRSLAAIECHFLSQHCFLEENYIWKHIEKIKHLPTAIAHGRYDAICAPHIAFELSKQFSKCCLDFVTAGHSSSDPKLIEALRKATQWVLQQI
ncbi:MAG: prolyl aminopeptidase [Deltaproteobacteria bacterium]|nr:prolyl aminopeptidase [Deltaproteobacteria bacterium]